MWGRSEKNRYHNVLAAVMLSILDLMQLGGTVGVFIQPGPSLKVHVYTYLYVHVQLSSQESYIRNKLSIQYIRNKLSIQYIRS